MLTELEMQTSQDNAALSICGVDEVPACLQRGYGVRMSVHDSCDQYFGSVHAETGRAG